MNHDELKIGDAVMFSYRDVYDRETGIGIVVELDPDPEHYRLYRVALIESDNQGYYWTDYASWESESKLTPIGKTVSDYNLSI